MFTHGIINKLFPVDNVVPVAILFQQIHVLMHQTLKIVIAHVQVFVLDTRDNFLQTIHVSNAKVSI